MEEIEINTEKTFKIESETDKNNKYSITFNLNNNFIEIIAEQINNKINKSFYNKFSSQEINENKYFIQFGSLSEIFEELKLRIYNNKIILKEENNILQIKIPLPLQNNNEIIFELKSKLKKKEIIIDEIMELVTQLKKECTELKNKNNEFQNEIKNIKNENEQLKKDLIEMKEKIDILWRGRNRSRIINGNEKYYNHLINWLQPKKNMTMELLYRLSENGEEYSTFHRLCDNQGPTITFFHVIDGNKVGIYTPISWGSSEGWKKDMNTFIFNLNKGQKAKKITIDYSDYNNSKCGPWIGTFGCSSSNTMRSIKHYGYTINDCYERGAEILPTGFQTKIYDLLEAEVYKITIE